MAIPVISNIIDFFKKAKAKVSAAFIAIFGADAAQSFATGALALLKTAEGVIVADAVQFAQLLGPAASGDEKYKVAFDKIVADLKAQGLPLATNLINLLIEVAVQVIVAKNIVAV